MYLANFAGNQFLSKVEPKIYFSMIGYKVYIFELREQKKLNIYESLY